MRPHASAVMTVVLAGALALTGCSSSSSGKPSTSSANLSHTSKFPSTTAASSTPVTSSTPSGSESVTKQQIEDVLLTGTDVTPNATATPDTPSDNPLPCAPADSKPLDVLVPSTVRAGVDIADDSLGAALTEEIRLYADDDTARLALSAAKSGLDCTNANIHADDGTQVAVTIGKPTDFLSDLQKDAKIADDGIESATAWSATAQGADLLLVVVQINRSLLLMTFETSDSADQSKLPDPEAIVEKAIEKGN